MLSNNRELELARLNIIATQHATDAATKNYYPKVLGSVTYFHFDQPLGKVLTTRGVVLPTTVSVNVLNQDSALSTVMVAQPITKLIAVNALVQIDQADERIARAKADKVAKDLLSGVTQAYYGLNGALRIRDALTLQSTVLGQMVEKDSNPVLRINLVEVRQGSVQVEGQVRDLVDELDDLLAFPPGTPLQLVDPLPPAPAVKSAEQAGQMALVWQCEVREAEQGIAKAEAALQIAKMDYLPDVNIVGGFANQTAANYIQPDIGYLGITANYTLWEWGQKKDVVMQRQTDIAMAKQNLQVTRDKVELAGRKAYGAFDQALQSFRLAGEMVQARLGAEKTAANPAAALTSKGDTAKAQLEYIKSGNRLSGRQRSIDGGYRGRVTHVYFPISPRQRATPWPHQFRRRRSI